MKISWNFQHCPDGFKVVAADKYDVVSAGTGESIELPIAWADDEAGEFYAFFRSNKAPQLVRNPATNEPFGALVRHDIKIVPWR